VSGQDGAGGRADRVEQVMTAALAAGHADPDDPDTPGLVDYARRVAVYAGDDATAAGIGTLLAGQAVEWEQKADALARRIIDARRVATTPEHQEQIEAAVAVMHDLRDLARRAQTLAWRCTLAAGETP